MPSEHLNAFPFAAVVGMDDGKRAIECALANPSIRTVLIRGGEGSAKTTLARSSGSIGSRRVVNCPLNVTDEQLFGAVTARVSAEGLEKSGVSIPHPRIKLDAPIKLLGSYDIDGKLHADVTVPVKVYVVRG